MAKVTVHLTGDEAKLLRALDRVVKKEREVANAAGKTGRASTRANKKAINANAAFVSSLKKAGVAFAGFAGVTKIFGSIRSSIMEARRETLGFENELTDLLSLGTNVENIAAIKDEVLAMSGAWGVSRKNIIDSMFDIQSGASGLSEEIRNSLRKEIFELVKVTSVDMPAATKLMVKAWNIYGDSLKDANQLQNKLFKTAELGFLNFQEMSEYLADVISPAKALGYTLDEVLASLVVATQKGGKTEKTFTGLRNVFIRMDRAVKEGLTTNKAFSEQLDDLAQVDPKIVSRIFGAETIAVINNLVSSTKEFGEALETVETVSGDIAKSKWWMRLKDTAFAFSEMIKAVEQMQKNIPITKEFAEGPAGKAERAYQMTKLGFDISAPSWARGWVGEGVAVINSIGALLGINLDVGEGKAGEAFYLNQLAKGGRPEEATYRGMTFAGRHEEAEQYAAEVLERSGVERDSSSGGKLKTAGRLLIEAGDEIAGGGRPNMRQPGGE